MNLKTCLRLTLAVSLMSTVFQGAAMADGTNVDEASQISVLQSQASPKEKDAACVWLKRHGTAQSVPALAALLTDEQLSQSARYALESMPGPEAEDALIAALSQTSGLLQWGVVKSLDVRHDARAVPELVKLLTGSDVMVANASAGALGDIATPAALKALEGQLGATNGAAENAVVDGCLRCAQHWLAAGKHRQAFTVYQEIYQRPGKEFIHVAAWRGMVLADGPRGLGLMADAITNGPAGLQMEAVQLAHEIKMPGATLAMARLLPKADPLTQVGLIDALAQRNDPAAAREIAEVASETNADVRIAAYTALGTLGSDKDIPLLIEAAAMADDPAQAAARQALLLVHRGTPDQALLALLSGSKPDAQVEICRALGNRSAVETTPQLLSLAKQADDPVREAAFQALARLVDQSHLDALVQIVAQMTTDDGRTAAAQAVSAACRHIERQLGNVDFTSLWTALKSGSTETRIALLPVCSGLVDPEARAILQAGVADTDPKIHAVAVRAMCDTMDVALLPDIEKLACGSSDEASRTPAIEACVRLATQEDSITIPDEDRIKLFQAIVPAAVNIDEKRVVLAGLAAIPENVALQLAQPFLSDVTVSNEAARAVIAICRKLPQTDAAEAALGSLVSGAVSDDVRQEAQGALTIIKARAEYVTVWQVVGPYRKAGQNYSALFDIPFPPETANAQGVKWRMLPANDNPNTATVMDLLKVMSGEQAVAYARTSIHSDSEQSAWLLVNSDDGVKAWLNGDVVHANNVSRAVAGPPDKVKVTLKAGWNDLLLKITQNNAGWGFIVRFTGPDGAPLTGLKYSADHGAM